jgi:hypothetical protein
MEEDMKGLALLGEVVAALAKYPALRVCPEVEMDLKGDGLLSVTLTAHPSTDTETLGVLELRETIGYIADVATVRGVVARYGLDASDFDQILTRAEYRNEPTTVVALTEAERDALDLFISSGCALGGMVRHELRPILLGIREKILADRQTVETTKEIER